MQIQTIFFDLDDTLYPSSCGLWPELIRRMERYMHEQLAIPIEEIPALRQYFFRTYGTTLRGLQIERSVDAREYLDYVHNVPLQEYLNPDPALREMLLQLKQRRLIFTNADANHARRVLRVLGVEDCFDTIIDILNIAPYCKPQPEAYQTALKLAGDPDPAACLMIDDSLRNLHGARLCGMHTVRVGSDETASECDASISRLVELPALLGNGRRPQ